MTESFERTSRLSLRVPTACTSYTAAQRRARYQGGRFNGTPGPLNDTITDVADAEAGQITLISGGGRLKVVTAPVRTGVTIILPRDTDNNEPVYGRYFNLNGNYKMTLQSYLKGLCNTNAIGQVYAGIQQCTETRLASQPTAWSPRLMTNN